MNYLKKIENMQEVESIESTVDGNVCFGIEPPKFLYQKVRVNFKGGDTIVSGNLNYVDLKKIYTWIKAYLKFIEASRDLTK